MHPLRCVFQVLGCTLVTAISIAKWCRKTKLTTLGKGVRQIGVVFGSGGLKHCGCTGLSAEDPRSWYKRRYRPDECHKAGYLFTRMVLSTNEMPVVMRYEGGQSARSEQHQWVKKKGGLYLMPQDVEDTWGRVEQLKMSVSVRSTPR